MKTFTAALLAVASVSAGRSHSALQNLGLLSDPCEYYTTTEADEQYCYSQAKKAAKTAGNVNWGAYSSCLSSVCKGGRYTPILTSSYETISQDTCPQAGLFDFCLNTNNKPAGGYDHVKTVECLASKCNKVA